MRAFGPSPRSFEQVSFYSGCGSDVVHTLREMADYLEQQGVWLDHMTVSEADNGFEFDLYYEKMWKTDVRS